MNPSILGVLLWRIESGMLWLEQAAHLDTERVAKALQGLECRIDRAFFELLVVAGVEPGFLGNLFLRPAVTRALALEGSSEANLENRSGRAGHK